MSAQDDILALEQQISELMHTVAAATQRRSICVSLLKAAEKNITIHSQSVTLHTNNITHVKRKADLVDLAEFTESRALLKSAREGLESARLEVAKTTLALAVIDADIAARNERLLAVREELNGYGRLYAFPS